MSPPLVDVHCHLIHQYFSDKLETTLQNAQKAGVKVIVVAGVNGATNLEILEMAIKYPVVKA